MKYFTKGLLRSFRIIKIIRNSNEHEFHVEYAYKKTWWFEIYRWKHDCCHSTLEDAIKNYERLIADDLSVWKIQTKRKLLSF